MGQQLRLALLPGDGIGPEVTEAARQVLEAVFNAAGITVEMTQHPVGWTAVRETGSPLPTETLTAALAADAVFLGAVGDPEADSLPPEQRPERGLLALRRALGCWANLRPVKAFPSLTEASPLRPERLAGVDLVIVRELAGGLYYGEPRGIREAEGSDAAEAWNTMRYDAHEIRRITELGFRTAAERRGKLVSVDKANVLEVSRLWRSGVEEVAEGFPEVEWSHMLVDRAAMELVLNPAAFDVLLMGNLFGDILSDEAAAVVGSIGLLPSASLGGATGLYEPVHGSAPELTGTDRANPIGAILSAALLLRHSLGLPREAAAIEEAVAATLEAGVRTGDLTRAGEKPSGTAAFTREVVSRLPA